MKSKDKLTTDFMLLGTALEKYLSISKMPIPFMENEKLFPSEMHAISYVCEAKQVSINQLADNFKNTKGAASQMVTKLVEKGFLTKKKDPLKQSKTIVEPTDKGYLAHKAHMDFHKQHDVEFVNYMENLSPDAYKTFHEVCCQLNRWMDQYLTNQEKS